MASAQDRRDIPEDVALDADRWFVTLGGSQVTADERAAFEAWLSQDPLHRRAYEESAGLWAQLDEPVARLAREQASHPGGMIRSAQPSWGYIAGAAMILLAVVMGALAWRDPGMLDRALADHATPPGERREITLADGSRLFLDGDTALSVGFSADARAIHLLRGRVWLNVAPDAARPFTVDAGLMEARVVGTVFAIDRDAARVVVEHGSVAVTAHPGDSARLGAGQAVSARGGQLGVPELVDSGSALSWRRGLIVLDAAPLGSLAEELHHMTPGRLVIPDSSLRKLTISGVFQADDPDAVIEAMRSALGLKTVTIPGLATLVYR